MKQESEKLKNLRFDTPTITHNGITFLDARGMHKRYKETFKVPKWSDINNLEAGDYIKASVNSEPFWIKVTFVSDSIITGVIDNDLLQTGLNYGQTIEVPDKCIMDIIKASQ